MIYDTMSVKRDQLERLNRETVAPPRLEKLATRIEGLKEEVANV